MYHGNVANMIHIFHSPLDEDSLQELEGDSLIGQALHVDTGHDVCSIRYKISKETFLLDPLCITETLRI